MADTVMPPGASRPPRRNGLERHRLAVLASVAIHAAILVPMALRLFEPDRVVPPPADAPIYIEMEPRPLLQGERSRVPAVAPPNAVAPETRPLTGPTVILRVPVRSPEEEKEETDIPSPPAPRVATGPAPAGTPEPPVDIGAWQVVPGSVGDRIGHSMRLGAGGCRIMDGRLNATEQRICDEAFNAAAARARTAGPRALNPSDARRQAQFARDGARALAQYEARRTPLRGGVGVVTSGEGVGGNFGTGAAGSHLDQSLQPTSTENIRTRRDGSRAADQPFAPGGGFSRVPD